MTTLLNKGYLPGSFFQETVSRTYTGWACSALTPFPCENSFSPSISIAFAVGKNLAKEPLKVFNYYDSHDIFERDPAMLAVGNRFGIVGVHLLYGKRKNGNVELTKREIRGLANMLKYFSKKSGIPENQIVVAGDFNLPASTIQNIVGHEQKVLIEEGTTVSTSKKRIAAHDYDHFVISKNMKAKAFVDYEVLGGNRSVKHRKWFRKKVSDHYPIVGAFTIN